MTAEAVSAAAQPGPGQIPCRVAQPQAPPARRAPPAAASAHLGERTLTRCAMTLWSPTW